MRGLYQDDGSLTAFCQGVCGVGVAHQAGSGLFDITRDGEVVECQDFGSKQINLNGHDNVVLRCVAGSSITSNGSAGRTHSALIEHATLDVGGRGKTKVIVGVFGNEFWGSAAAPFVIRRSDISGGEDGISLGAGEHVHLIENYVHGLVGIAGPGCDNDCHSDAIHLTARGRSEATPWTLDPLRARAKPTRHFSET